MKICLTSGRKWYIQVIFLTNRPKTGVWGNIPANMRHYPMLGQRRRRWTNVGQCLMFGKARINLGVKYPWLVSIDQRHLKWTSDEFHLTLRRNTKACHETSNEHADGRIFVPSYHANPHIKSESYLGVHKLYTAHLHIILFFIVLYITQFDKFWMICIEGKCWKLSSKIKTMSQTRAIVHTPEWTWFVSGSVVKTCGRNMIFVWKFYTKRHSKPHGRQRHRQSATL